MIVKTLQYMIHKVAGSRSLLIQAMAIMLAGSIHHIVT